MKSKKIIIMAAMTVMAMMPREADALFGVLADVASRLLGFDLLRKLLLPESEEGFVHLKHFGYLADGVVEFEFFIGIEGHSAWVLCSLRLP